MSQTIVEAAEARAPGRPLQVIVGTYLPRGIVAALLIWLAWEFYRSPSQFFSFTLDGLNKGALYALIALGYTLVYGIIELINFAHGDLFMLGTVVSALLAVNAFSVTSPSIGGFIALIGLMIVVMAAAALVNTTAERVAYRRLRRAPKLAPLITAVGLSFVFQWAGTQLNGSGQKNWPTTLLGQNFKVGSVTIDWSTIVVIGATVPLLLLLTWVIRATRQGKAMRATAQDQDAARLMGIDVDRTIAFTFAIGGALAGAAGLLYMQTFGTTRFDAGFQLGLIAFTSAVLGGIGNLNGAVLGAFLIGLIQSYDEGFGLGQKWSQTVVFTILIAVMVFRPAGLLGSQTTEKV
jgi:branched-chain amino acid transport system permease protein